MRRLASLPGRRRATGVSLLETLIALLLLSVGVLSMAAVQAAAVKYTKLAQFKGLATQYSNEIADRMRANVNGATSGNYNRSEDDYDADAEEEDVPDCSVVAACTPAEIAAIDLADVHNEVRVGLPAGGFVIQQSATAGEANVLTIWMIWQEQDAAGSDAADSSAVADCPVDGASVRCQAMKVAL